MQSREKVRIKMTDFIIDEMVIRECDSFTAPDGTETFRSLDFMSSFIESKHRLGLNDTIEKKYRNYQKTIKDAGIFTTPLSSRIINRILRNDKIIKVSGTPGNYNSIRAKKCDIHFVGVSIQLRGILVTNDEPLKNNIENQGLNSQFSTVKIEDAKTQI